MDALECIRTRKSIRAFKPEPVPKEVLTEVIATAGRSPSYKNSQPWEVAVLSGAKKEALSAHVIELFESGELSGGKRFGRVIRFYRDEVLKSFQEEKIAPSIPKRRRRKKAVVQISKRDIIPAGVTNCVSHSKEKPQ